LGAPGVASEARWILREIVERAPVPL
jgi:hypothetical protein